MDPRSNPLPPPPPPVLPPQQRPGNSEPPKSILKGIGSGLAAAGVAALKFGFLALKSFKTSISLILMIWVYWLFFGWPFAVGIVGMLFIHEMGHVVAAKLLGLPVNMPMFIPFFGAMTTINEAPKDAWTEALFATGGPLAGAIASWLVMVAGFYFNMPFLVAVASVGFVLNLFNMIPVPPFDGGGMCAAVSRWFWLVGLVMLGLALVYFHSLYSTIFIALIVLFMTWPKLQMTLFQEDTEDMQAYYATHISNRLTMALMYLGIVAMLLLGYGHASGYLTPLMENHPAAASLQNQ